MNKKGLSEVVTTVLIILLVLAAVIIIWTVLKPMIERSSQQINTDSITSNLIIAPNSLQVSEDNNVTLKVLRKVGEGNITGVNIIIETASGQRKTFKVPGEIKELETKTITIPSSLHGITEEITKVLVSAIITNSNGEEVSSSITSGTNVATTAPVCGDGTIQSGEDCDGTNLNGKSCQTLGYLTGTLACTSSCTFDTSQCFDLNNGLVSYYKFDETSYSGAAGEVKDQKGRNNGTSFGSMSTVAGKIGRSASFNGIAQYIAIPGLDGNNFNFSKNFTIATWVKPFSFTPDIDRVIAGLTTSWNGGDNIFVLKSNGSLQIQIFGAGLFSTSAMLAPSTWTYVAWTYSESDRKGALYINGNKDNEHTFSPFTQNISATFRIGRFGNGWYLNGSMDDFMLFNRTLSTSEIQLIYNSYS